MPEPENRGISLLPVHALVEVPDLCLVDAVKVLVKVLQNDFRRLPPAFILRPVDEVQNLVDGVHGIFFREVG